MWVLFLSFPLLGVLAVALFGDSGILAMLALGTGYLMAGWRAASARCPRCGDHFSRKRGVAYGWNQHCLHCGLPLRL
jgi:hypothetical protein